MGYPLALLTTFHAETLRGRGAEKFAFGNSQAQQDLFVVYKFK